MDLVYPCLRRTYLTQLAVCVFETVQCGLMDILQYFDVDHMSHDSLIVVLGWTGERINSSEDR